MTKIIELSTDQTSAENFKIFCDTLIKEVNNLKVEQQSIIQLINPDKKLTSVIGPNNKSAEFSSFQSFRFPKKSSQRSGSTISKFERKNSFESFKNDEF